MAHHGKAFLNEDSFFLYLSIFPYSRGRYEIMQTTADRIVLLEVLSVGKLLYVLIRGLREVKEPACLNVSVLS